jgi:hypothetical protein
MTASPSGDWAMLMILPSTFGAAGNAILPERNEHGSDASRPNMDQIDIDRPVCLHNPAEPWLCMQLMCWVASPLMCSASEGTWPSNIMHVISEPARYQVGGTSE